MSRTFDLECIEEPGSADEMLTEIEDLALEGLLVDGAHHKQWYLERILDVMGALPPCGWEPGVAP